MQLESWLKSSGSLIFFLTSPVMKHGHACFIYSAFLTGRVVGRCKKEIEDTESLRLGSEQMKINVRVVKLRAFEVRVSQCHYCSSAHYWSTEGTVHNTCTLSAFWQFWVIPLFPKYKNTPCC